MRNLTAALSAVVLAGGALVVSAPAQAAHPTRPTVSIRAELDLPDQDRGPKTYVANDVVVGSGVELSAANVQPGTAYRWSGDIKVDVNPTTKKVTIAADGTVWDFKTVKVWITSADLRFGAQISDTLMPGVPVKRSISGNKISLSWDAGDHSENLSGTHEFSYKHTSSISANAKSAKKKQVSVTAAATTFGMPAAATGTVEVREGKKLIKTFAIKNGKGSTNFIAKPGKHAYKITYTGAADRAPATVSKTVKVKK